MAMMRMRVANSDGWSWKGPSGNHRWAPWLEFPMGQDARQGEQGADVEDRAQLFETSVVEQDDPDHDHRRRCTTKASWRFSQ